MAICIDKMTARRLATAAALAGLFSTPVAAQMSQGENPNHGIGMPANCQQNLDKCSERVWTHNSFPSRGSVRTVTFDNGWTLTCVSNGANVPRTCKLIPNHGVGEQAEAYPEMSPADAQAQALRQKCADLKQDLRTLTDAKENAQSDVGRLRAYLARAMQMTPDVINSEIQRLSDIPIGQRSTLNRSELNFLRDLSANQALGPGAGFATPEQMQARANRLANDWQAWNTDQQTLYGRDIADLDNQMNELNCANVGSPNQSAGAP